MASLGEELKRERELRAISLKEIANLTKINIRYLRALEEDKLDLLPGTFFIKGVLRSYSKCIGVDENYFVNKYHEEVLLQQDAQDKERRRREDIPLEPQARRSWLRRSLAFVFLLLLSALAVVYFFVIKPQKDHSPSRRQPAVAPPQEQQIATSTIPPAVHPEGAAQEEELRLELTFLAETWIQVKADGQIQVDGLKKAGERASCAAKTEFILQTGNAGGVSLTINGRPGKPLGASGAVLTDIRINRENLSAFLAAPEKTAAEKVGR